MHEDFIGKKSAVSYELYRKIFDQQNIAFGSSSTDDCDTCLKFKSHKSQLEGTEHNENECELCQRSEIHLKKASEAREHYRKDMKENNCFCVDMQKVIILPKLTTKESFFTSRLVCFNETFASGDEGKDYTVMWHEGISGRKACDVASAYTKFFTEANTKFPILWADNCAGQNKNWVLYSSFAQIVNADWGPEEITMKYLEPGHTFMKADTVHGVIGKRMKRTPEIVTFKELTSLVSSSSSRISMIEMNVDDFYKYLPGNRARNTKNVRLPKLSDIVEVKFAKDSRLMYYKGSHEENEYTGVDFLKVKFDVNCFPEKLRVPRGISSKKQAGIVQILSHVDPLKRKFYTELYINDASEDLVSRFDL